MSSFSPFWHLEVFPVWAAQLLLHWHVSQNRCCRAFPLQTFLSTYMQMIQEYFFKCRLGFGDVQLGQLSLFSPASHQNSAQTTLLFSHHSYSSQGLLTSLLISLHVLWFGQYVFTVWAKKCWGHHTSWRRTCETRLGLSLWIWALLLRRAAWSWISLWPNNAFSGIYE